MRKKRLKYYEPTIIKGLITALLLLFISSGSYTYSEGIEPIPGFKNSKNLFFESSFANLSGIKARGWYKNIKAKKQVKPTNIFLQYGRLSTDKMAAYLLSNNEKIGKERAIELAGIYIEEAKHEGINWDIAFSQMCLETGFLKFGGDVEAGQNNFCGLGVTGGGVKGLSFEDERTGIRAHIQHLKAYASTKKLNNNLVDSRFRFVKRGSVNNINDLTGKWASDKNYGEKISDILVRIENSNY